MIRAVLDADIVISAMLVPHGVPGRVVDAAGASFALVWSTEIVAECIRVVGYPRLGARFQVSDPMGFLASLADTAELIAGDLPRVGAVRADPSDDVYLATALAGAAPFLVTGDRKHLLALKEFAGVRIVTPGEFLTAIGKR